MDSWNGYILLVAVGSLIYIVLLHILPEVYFEDEDNHDQGSKTKKAKDEKPSQGAKFFVLLAGIFTV